ncbi:MAG: DUF3179 domain-containing protein [Acidimicrobiales bacterium]
MDCSDNPAQSSASVVASSGLDWLFGRDFPASFESPELERTSIVPVLAADGIPAIDDPQCLPVGAVDFLTDNAPVVVVEVAGEARAYPLEILTWHELVNDTIAGVAVTISYCPLCNSAIAYERTLADRVLDFGTSGALNQSSLVMYDRQTETLWTHFDGRAVAGELVGEQLQFVPAAVVAWGSFREEFPDGLVLSRETGFNRSYGLNPYPGYDSAEDPIASFITADIDPRMEAKARIVGVVVGEDAVAVPRGQLLSSGVVSLTVSDRPVTVWSLSGTASALDDRRVSGGDDVGAVAAFEATSSSGALSFQRTTTGFVDDQTGSSWNIFGLSTDGPLMGTQLEKVRYLDTFWFAWGNFYPDTTIAES